MLRDRHGKTLKKLPPGEVQERIDADKALAALKRTTGQVMREQTARLYDAMCAGRRWRTAAIDAHLFRHPIVSRLCRRLVFAGLDAQGGVTATFRLNDDGMLVTAAGERLDIDGFAAIQLAHRARLDEADVATWRTVIEASPVAPPFDQLTRPLRRAGDLASTSPDIRDREGHLVERPALLKAAAKLGYRHEDGEVFAILRKSFPMAETDALIEFVGGQLPDSTVPCALIGLRFVRTSEPLPPPAVPPILLSEAWNDYHAIAAAGPGFDPDWQAKVRW